MLFHSLPPIPAVVFRQAEGLAHGGGGHVLRGGVQVRVDIHGGADVAVTQPLLDILLQSRLAPARGEWIETALGSVWRRERRRPAPYGTS